MVLYVVLCMMLCFVWWCFVSWRRPFAGSAFQALLTPLALLVASFGRSTQEYVSYRAATGLLLPGICRGRGDMGVPGVVRPAEADGMWTWGEALSLHAPIVFKGLPQ